MYHCILIKAGCILESKILTSTNKHCSINHANFIDDFITALTVTSLTHH